MCLIEHIDGGVRRRRRATHVGEVTPRRPPCRSHRLARSAAGAGAHPCRSATPWKCSAKARHGACGKEALNEEQTLESRCEKVLAKVYSLVTNERLISLFKGLLEEKQVYVQAWAKPVVESSYLKLQHSLHTIVDIITQRGCSLTQQLDEIMADAKSLMYRSRMSPAVPDTARSSTEQSATSTNVDVNEGSEGDANISQFAM